MSLNLNNLLLIFKITNNGVILVFITIDQSMNE